MAATFGLIALALHESTELVGKVALVQSMRALDQAKHGVSIAPSSTSRLAPDTEQQRLQQLQLLLSGTPHATEQVRLILSLAQNENITVAQSEYQHQVNGLTGAVQVQVTQPVRATYPQLRHYMEAVLLALPNASLDQISAKRESADQTHVEARLKWSLWLIPAQASEAAP